MREKLQPIADPAAHAREVTGYECRVLSDESPWQRYMIFRTTGGFEKLDRTFHQHCGPTALTNVIGAIQRRRGMACSDPEEVFVRCAAAGQRRAAYWNIPEKFRLGGTSYLLLPSYARFCLRQFGIRDTRVSGHLLASPEQMAAEIAKGRLLCLTMIRHRCYGSHVVVAYGAVRISPAGRGAPRLYLRIADGWASRPRYLAADTLGLCGYVSIQV